MSDKYYCRDCLDIVHAEQFLSDDLPECDDCYGNDLVPVADMDDEDKAMYRDAELQRCAHDPRHPARLRGTRANHHRYEHCGELPVKFEIKSRWSGSVLFTIETDTLKLAVEAAVKSCADLHGADLRGAYLRDADLRGAYLRGADLHGADDNKITLVGDRPYFAIGPIGSRNDTLQAWLTDAGVYIKAGCFCDTLDKFAAAVETEHGDSVHGQEYRQALAQIELHAKLWTPATEAKTEAA